MCRPFAVSDLSLSPSDSKSRNYEIGQLGPTPNLSGPSKLFFVIKGPGVSPVNLV